MHDNFLSRYQARHLLPISMAPSRIDEEFVFTISDNDELSISEAESEPEAKNLKRKRAAGGQLKTSKKQKVSKKHEPEPVSEHESDEAAGVKDGAIDSDFEFDIGGAGADDSVEDFDAWGDGDTSLTAQRFKPAKPTVDVDEIIARRAARKDKNKAQEELENGTSVHESVDEDADEIDFDDENLAEDAFGAGADSENEQDGLTEGSNKDGDEAELHEGEDEDEDEAASDNDSTASPVAHPDDMASDAGSDDESQTSQEDPEEAAKRKAFFADDDASKPTKSLSGADSFQQFSLSRPLLRALAALNFTIPTPIQVRTIPVALQGLDVVGSAQTGSGKTAAFLLPILERLLYRPRKIPTTRVAILMPTRELAVQCHAVAIALARFTDITFAQVIGGMNLREQEAILKKRPDVVIATPGRFIDHMRNSASFAVENLEILVLDEADRMLEQGFTDELDEILKTIPRSRQTMLFSATMTSSVDKLVRVGMNKPVRLSVDSTHGTVSGLSQEFLRLRPGRDTNAYRLAALCLLVTTIPDYQQRTIIFLRTKATAHRVRIILGLLGLKASELHGSMTQDQRIASVSSFRDGKTTHLLATDVASRGLDIKNVHSVINYEAPQTHDIYLHRVGRTARAGKSGKSCTLAAEPDRKVVKSAVRAARSQGAKVSSRTLDATALDAFKQKLDDLDDEVTEILAEEKQEKQLAQMETDVARADNIMKHRDEIMSRPKRTWFESEKEKQANKERAKAEAGLFMGEKKKLSNKDKKRLDLSRDRKEGRQWKKGKDDGVDVKKKGGKGGAGKAKAKGKGKAKSGGGKR